MIHAIIDRLKTGSITNVYPKGDPVVNPIPPYIYVWQKSPVMQPGSDNYGKNFYIVSVHYPQGFINYLDDYIDTELMTLLHKFIATARDGRKVQLYLDGQGISGLIEGNADKTISKERQVTTAGIFGI